MATYATLDQLLASYPVSTRPDYDDDQLVELQNQLQEVTDAITDEVSFDFFRHPETDYDPAEERLLDGKSRSRLHVHEGIIELELVEVRDHPTSAYVELDADDYVLHAMYGRQGRPADHVDLTRRGRTVWPCGPDAVRLTGTFGFPEVPGPVRRATIAWVRQGISGSDSFSGGQAGPDEFGRVVATNLMPNLVYRLFERERNRYMGCAT